MTQPTLLTISGSLRRGSFNRKLLKFAADAFGPATVAEADIALPVYDRDFEDVHGIPATVQLLADQISAADAIVISSPEYNKGIPGVLKNALDWVSRVEGRVFKDKPVAVIMASGGRAGGETAYYMIQHCLLPLGVRLVNGPAVLVAGASKEFDDGGQLTNERYLSALKTRMEGLRAAIG